MRTSQTHPLQIAAVSAPGVPGKIGLTLCPGKKDPWGGSGPWDRDLEIDLLVVRDWGADIVVTLLEASEFDLLKVISLGDAVERSGLKWLHLPIGDGRVPNARFETDWQMAGAELRRMLRRGRSVLVHCRGGLGRAGTIAGRVARRTRYGAEGRDPGGARGP